MTHEWECPTCQTRHQRGWFITPGQHRCLTCGYNGDGGTVGPFDDYREPPPILYVPVAPSTSPLAWVALAVIGIAFLFLAVLAATAVR